MEWKTIDTAPKDGTYVITLVLGFRATISWFKNGEWVNDGWAVEDFRKAGYLMLDDDNRYKPTHWMPLPEPPKEA